MRTIHALTLTTAVTVALSGIALGAPTLSHAADAPHADTQQNTTEAAERATIKHRGVDGTVEYTVDTEGTVVFGPGQLGPSKGLTASDWRMELFGPAKKIVFSDPKNTFFPDNSNSFFYTVQGIQEFVGIEEVDVSNVTSMASMFHGVWAKDPLDLTSWDVSNVTNMRSMFRGSAFRGLDVHNWDVSGVTNMEQMFYAASALENLDVSAWDVSNVKNFAGTFDATLKLTRLDLSNWDTRNANGTHALLRQMRSLDLLVLGPHTRLSDSRLDESGWNTNWRWFHIDPDNPAVPLETAWYGMAFELDQLSATEDFAGGTYHRALVANVTLDENVPNELGVSTQHDLIRATFQQLATPENVFKRAGYAITGWNTEPDGSGTVYTDTTVDLPEEHTVLYAQWAEIAEPQQPGHPGENGNENNDTPGNDNDTSVQESGVIAGQGTDHLAVAPGITTNAADGQLPTTGSPAGTMGWLAAASIALLGGASLLIRRKRI